MHVYESLPELIGNTPILELKRSGSVWKPCWKRWGLRAGR